MVPADAPDVGKGDEEAAPLRAAATSLQSVGREIEPPTPRRLAAVTHRATTAEQLAEAEAVLGRTMPPAAQHGRGGGLCSSCDNTFISRALRHRAR